MASQFRISQWMLTPKLVLLLIVFAVIPMGVIATIGVFASYQIEDVVGKRLASMAFGLGDKIDRNLFERYTDVKAFSLNHVLNEREAWYQTSEAGNAITRAMNAYIANYKVYSLSIVVDLQGNVIAVNSRDGNGEPIDSTFLYQQNYRDRSWFQALEQGVYTSDMPFTASGNDQLSGTFIEDVHVDPDVQRAYGNHNILTLGFSAPVYKEGEVIAYWSNRTNFALIGDLIQQAYMELEASGYPSAEVTVLDATGRVLVDYDPSSQTTKNIVNNMDVLFTLNLVEKGISAAQQAVLGKTGYGNAFHARRHILQIAGYTHLDGALGFPGMNWSVLVRVPVEDALAQAIAIQRTILLAVLICSLLVIPLGVWIGRKIVGRVKPVMEVANLASQGDFSRRVPVTTQDELGQIGQALNGFLDHLNHIMKQFNQVVQAVATSSEKLSVNGHEVALASREQTSQATQVATAVDEMSATACEMARNAQVLAGTAQEVNHSAVKGGEIVANSINGMETVTTTMQASADQINALGKRSQEIGEIIRVIEDIADQTNLLALNAAIEAARAGEQGRGFAVVADEVRKLAERTGKATKEIAGVIETVQVGTQEAVQSMEAGTTEAQNGMLLAREAGQRLNEIVEGVQRVADMIHQIAGSTEEQSLVSDQIAQNIQAVASLSQQNENSVGEVAAATGDIARMASELQASIRHFRL
ncbi:methyl-accepting chemotaxis protein [Nitrospira sp. M1]